MKTEIIEKNSTVFKISQPLIKLKNKKLIVMIKAITIPPVFGIGLL